MSEITPSDQLVAQTGGGDVGGMAQGLASALNSYLGGQLKSQQDMATKQGEADIEANKEIKVAKAQHDIDNPPAGSAVSYLDPTMAEKALPGYGANMVADYNKRNPNAPLTIQQGAEYIAKAHEMLQSANPDTAKEDAHQDMLEKQSMDRLTQVRGDQSLMRAEHQRDAAGMAYDTIAKAKAENRDLTELEQTDLIGQLWQARTGKAPTDSDMKLLNERTAKRGFNHMITYLTGEPTLIGSSTRGTLANLQQFIEATGNKADQQWSAYMNPRLIKPTGLKQERWDHIVSQQRGISFKDQKMTSDKTHGVKDDLEAKKAALRAKLGI